MEAMAVVDLHAQLAPRGALLPGVLLEAAPPQKDSLLSVSSDELAGNKSAAARPVRRLSSSPSL
jgi:hypothetical protein